MIFTILAFLFPIFGVVAWALGDEDWADGTSTGWKKCGVYLGATWLFCATINSLLYLGAIQKTKSSEVRNYYTTSMVHQERWSERERRSRQVPCGRDKDGHTIYRTEYYYVTEYYGPYWTANDSDGHSRGVSEAVYQEWAKTWGNEHKTGENRGSAAGLTRPITGGIFQIDWTKQFNTVRPVSYVAQYENRVRVSNSTFNLPPPEQEFLDRFPRPADIGHVTPVVNYDGVQADYEGFIALHRLNAMMGSRHQIHLMVVLFDANLNSAAITEKVIAAWNMPNKNELVTMVGVKNQRVGWCKVFSWSDDTTIHASIQSDVYAMDKFTLLDLKPILEQNVNDHWKRKEFSSFDYLRVDIHHGWVIVSLVLMAGFSVGAYFFIDKGDLF